MTAFDLASIAPRLALAQRQRRLELLTERAERRHMLRLLRRAEWCVAHRELQLARAGSTRSARYIERRTRLLDQARSELARLRVRAAEIGVTA